MRTWIACTRCGREYFPTGSFPTTDGLCPTCRGDDIAATAIEDGETEFIGEDEVRCPWCGKRADYEVDDRPLDDISEEECPHCGKRYEVTPMCHWTYDTKRVPE